ncbi:MAG: LEA type 2 family protein [Paludibacter sp.]
MTKATKILLIAGAGLGLWYIPTVLALLNLDVSIVSLLPTNIRESYIDTLVTVKLKNKSGVRVNMQYIKADILLNGQKIAQFSQTERFVILPHGEQNFNVNFTIDAETVGQEIWTQLIAANLQNYVLDVVGTIGANRKILPFRSTWTIKDFTA